MTSNPDRDQTVLVQAREIRRVSLHGPFEMDGGRSSPVVLRTQQGWRLRIEDPFLVAELADETHLVPLENVAGINVAPAIPAQAPQSDDGAKNSATTPLTETVGKRRARASGRR